LPCALYLADPPGGGKPLAAGYMLLLHGVRSCLESEASWDALKARALSNPDLSPHLSFVDFAGHGYATVLVESEAIETKFVGIERPLERSERADGGPLRYRVAHRARLWKRGERPRLEQRVLEGDAGLSI
jgi:alkaline phosphatase D